MDAVGWIQCWYLPMNRQHAQLTVEISAGLGATIQAAALTEKYSNSQPRAEGGARLKHRGNGY